MPSRLTQNMSIKLFSLLVSLVLFMFVGIESSTAIDVQYPLDYETTEDIMITSNPPAQVTVTLRGPWVGFRTFDSLEPVVINLRDTPPGAVQRALEARSIHAPAGMTVVSIQPSLLDLTLERRIEKWVAVEATPEGRPRLGYEIANIRTEPTQVRVSGPASKMQTLDFIHTRAVNIEDKTENLSVAVELRPPPPPLRLLNKNPVQVFVEINEEILRRNMQLKVSADEAPKDIRFQPEKVLVTVEGPRLVVDQIDIAQMQAVVDITPENPWERQFERPIELRPALPELVQIIGQLPRIEITLPRTRKR